MAIVDPFDTAAVSATPKGIVDPFETGGEGAPRSARSLEPAPPWSEVPMAAVRSIPSDIGGTLGSFASLGKSAAETLIQGPFITAYKASKAIYDDPSLLKRLPQEAWQGLMDTYGSEEAIRRTIANHPVQFALDLATIYSGGAGVARRVAGGLGELGRATEVSRPFHDIARAPEPAATPPAPTLSETEQARQRSAAAGMPIDLPRALTMHPIFQSGAVALSKAPVVGAPLASAISAVPEQMGGHVETIAGQYGRQLPENIVGSGIERTLTGAAEREATVRQAAATTADEAARQQFEQTQQAREQAVRDRQAQATNAAERTFGNVNPMEMAQDTINDVQSAHRQARDRKDRLYGDVNNLDARVHTAAFADLRSRAEQALVDAGVNIDDPGSNASRMLRELDRLSGRPGELPTGVPPRLLNALEREYGTGKVPPKVFEDLGFPGASDAVSPDFRMLGPHAPAAGADAIPVQGLEHLNKRIGRMGMEAETPEDRYSSRIVKNAFDNWRNDVLDSHLTPDSAPNARSVIDAARASHRDLMERFGYNYSRQAEGEPRNATKMLNQIVTGGIGPEGVRDSLIGAKPGNRRISAPLYEAISNAVPNANEFRNRVRGAYWNEISGGSPTSIASDVEGLRPTRMGAHLFEPHEHDLMQGFSDLSQRTPQDLKEIAATKPPKPTKVEPGPTEQLAGRIVGRTGGGEQVLGRLDNAMRKGGDIKEAARVWGKMSDVNRNEFKGSVLRGLGGGGEEFNLGKFVKNWDDYSDQAKAFMFDREHRQNLNDFHRIAKQYQETIAKYGNPSGTAQVSAWHKLLTGGIKTGVEVATGVASIFHPVGVALAGLGAYKVAKILGTPQGARNLTQWSRLAKSYQSAPSASKLAALSQMSRTLNATGD